MDFNPPIVGRALVALKGDGTRWRVVLLKAYRVRKKVGKIGRRIKDM